MRKMYLKLWGHAWAAELRIRLWARSRTARWAIRFLAPAGASTYEVSVAAATAVLNYDMFQNASWKTANFARLVRALAVCGSAAAGDSRISLRVGQVEVADKYNTTTGFPTRDHLVGVGAAIPAGAPISAIVTDAPATNPLNILIDIAP